MITLFETLQQYCNDKNRQPASPEELMKIGHLVSKQFKDVFCKADPLGTIRNTAFVKISEGEREYVVSGYPDTFLDDMIQIIHNYYSKKPNNVQKIIPKTAQAKRKRIPIKRDK